MKVGNNSLSTDDDSILISVSDGGHSNTTIPVSSTVTGCHDDQSHPVGRHCDDQD